MSIDAFYTLGVVGLLVLALASNKVGADTAMVGALTLLMVGGVLDASDAILGFAHPAVIMIAALFVVATGLGETGATEFIAKRVLGRPRGLVGAQLRMMGPVAGMSAFMNNTPVVAMYLPIVDDWARKLRLSPSRLFMPLSYAAILGGACTLIGTSSNITINRLYVDFVEANGGAFAEDFGIGVPSTVRQFWGISVIGIPATVLGIGMIVLMSKRLLPERRPAYEEVTEGRQYTVELEVEAKSVVVGQSIEAAGLRALPGLYLSSIERGGVELPAVGPDEVLQAGDRLEFVGIVESVVDLLKIKGLVPATDQVAKVDADRRDRMVVEAVVSADAPFVRKTVRASQFRTRYNAAIIAVHRGAQRVKGKIGDIVLQPGDTLLLSTHRGFVPSNRNSGHFYLVSHVERAKDVRHERAWVAVGIMVLLVLLLTVPASKVAGLLNGMMGLGLPERDVSPIIAAFVCATLMVFTRCCTGTLARANMNWQVLIVIGAALGIGKAMTQTGAAAGIAHGLMEVVGGLGPRAVLLVLLVLTSVFAQLVTNNGAAVLMFPIAMGAAGELGVSPEPFAVALMASAACSFMTPIGYQTNLMVYGPGGYRFSDYLRLGAPLTVLVAILGVLIAPVVFPFGG